MNIFPKAYFIDFIAQTTEEIMQNIQKMHRDDFIVLRHFDENSHNKNAVRIIQKLAKRKHITVLSHFQNSGIKYNIHLASSRKKSISYGKTSISFHTSYDLHRLQVFKPDITFLSPIFQTQTHADIKPLGKIKTFKVILQIKQVLPQTQVFLLGGMTKKRFILLQKLDFKSIITGYAGIRWVF